MERKTRRRRELIEARNQADSMAYSAEKNVKEFGDKIDAVRKGTHRRCHCQSKEGH